MKRLLLTILIFFLSIPYSYGFSVPEKVYRGWNHVKSMVIFDPNHKLFNPFGGIHHVYVNEKGLKAIKEGKGREFPDGSVVVFLLYEHIDAGGAFVEGAKKIEAFMVKDRKKYSNTGGWGFYAYDGQGRSLVKDPKADCFSCHAQQEEKDFVFSDWKE